MSNKKYQTYFFLLVILASVVLTLLVFRPYLVLLAFGGVLSILFRPFYQWLLKHLKTPVGAAFISVICMALAVLLPLTYFAMALYDELAGVVSFASGHFDATSLLQTLRSHLPASLDSQAPAIMDAISKLLRDIGATLSAGLIGFFGDVVGVAFRFLIVMIMVYYFLKDGDKIKKRILLLSPLDDSNDELVLHRVVVAVRAVMGGVLVVGALKAIVAAVAFSATGIPAPIFWAAMTGLASLLPILGTALITVPAILYLWFTGHIAGAVILLVVAVGVINPIDNLLQPKLVESKTNIHPLLILLSILGGLKFFGFAGFILGPLTLAVTMALLDIYEREFRSYLQGIQS